MRKKGTFHAKRVPTEEKGTFRKSSIKKELLEKVLSKEKKEKKRKKRKKENNFFLLIELFLKVPFSSVGTRFA